jgi:hypothetical protein
VPFNHTGNTANGNALNALSSGPGHTLAGRMTQLPIYEVRYYSFSNSALSGPNFDKLVRSIQRDDIRDLTNGYRQPTNHNDQLGNLPAAPGGRVVYREYFLTGNAFPNTGFVRVVADMGNRRLFVTPTHYDVFLSAPAAAAMANVNNAIAPATPGAHNPFFLISGAGAVNDIFL